VFRPLGRERCPGIACEPRAGNPVRGPNRHVVIGEWWRRKSARVTTQILPRRERGPRRSADASCTSELTSSSALFPTFGFAHMATDRTSLCGTDTDIRNFARSKSARGTPRKFQSHNAGETPALLRTSEEKRRSGDRGSQERSENSHAQNRRSGATVYSSMTWRPIAISHAEATLR
jgi:hypothetical protein